MKIVIELPADDFNAIYHGGLCDIRHDKLDQAITEAFQTATIIPKGHGDLIDRKKLIESPLCKTFGLRRIDIENAPTIIEADTESEE